MDRRASRRGMAALLFAVLLAALTPGLPVALAATPVAGAVYTLTNDAAGNGVVVFARGWDGSLTPVGTVPTGGLGTGSGLGSQGAVALSQNGRWLFAVDAGSDEVSVLAVTPGGLTLIDTVASGGDMPISLTQHRNLLYVLNAGGAGNITGFTIGSQGTLTPLAGSTRPLSGAATMPAQVSFSPDGRLLAVTEKATNLIDTYTVAAGGLATGPMPQASEGMTPFGFAFDPRGRLVVSEAFGGATDASAVSSYRVTSAGSLTAISPSVATTETAACWVAITKNGRFAYATNTGSGSISGYRIAPDGRLSLLDADGRTADTGAGSAPSDVAIDPYSKYLYVRNGGSRSIGVFEVLNDGSLMPRPGMGSLPTGSVGLAVR